MTARGKPQFALRPYLPQDTPLLAEIFRASVEGLTEDDYTPAQQDAWISEAEDLEGLTERLGKHLALIATLDGTPVGFLSLDAPTEIGLFYVHPDVAGQGVGRMLYDAIEKISAARGTPHLSVDASDTARDFFAHRGFTAEQRNSMSVGNEWLSNTTMKKKLTVDKGTLQ
jgi:putative acetyltransferase